MPFCLNSTIALDQMIEGICNFNFLTVIKDIKKRAAEQYIVDFPVLTG